MVHENYRIQLLVVVIFCTPKWWLACST